MNDTIVSQINLISQEHLKIKPIKITPITSGLFNKTYILDFDAPLIEISSEERNIKKIIIRIAPPEDTGFIFYEKNMMWQEPNIHAQILKNTQVPIPEIFFSDFTRKIINRDFLIMECLPGVPMRQAYNFKKMKKVNAYYQTGNYLKQVHQIHNDEYGYVGKHAPCPTKDNWWDAFGLMWRYLQNDLIESKTYTKEESEKFIEVLKKHEKSFKKREVPSSLLHMDIWQENILVNEQGMVNGIVDWDRSLSGDPEIEFAVIDYCGFNNEAFWAGYGERQTFDLDLRIRMNFYILYEHQKYMIINTYRRPDKAKVLQYKDACLDLLKQLDEIKK